MGRIQGVFESEAWIEAVTALFDGGHVEPGRVRDGLNMRIGMQVGVSSRNRRKLSFAQVGDGLRVGQFEGIPQTDGYSAYDRIGGPRMVHAACWAHARRQFFEAVRLNPRDPVATPIVAQMDELFAVDAEARRGALTSAARHIRRQETAKPLLDDIRSKIDAAQSDALPSSTLSKDCQYALTLWRKLTRFLEYPELELSNNLADNSMRPVALGRKNWIHIGSPQAGPKVAAILSVVESCRRLKVPVRDYFSAIHPGLADLPIRASQTLLPLRGSPGIHELSDGSAVWLIN
jgi:transposase